MDSLDDLVEEILRQVEEGINVSEDNITHNYLYQGSEYLEDMLDIQYIISGRDGKLTGAKILMLGNGGPEVWINTSTQRVEGYWGDEVISHKYSKDSMGIEKAVFEMYHSH
jgi:hypothetical protein